MFVAWLAVPLVAAEIFTGRVVGVSDGNTISVMRDGHAVRVRLEGIDCPENSQDFGQRAKQFAAALVFQKTVTVDVRDVDRYGRLVGRVFVGFAYQLLPSATCCAASIVFGHVSPIPETWRLSLTRRLGE